MREQVVQQIMVNHHLPRHLADRCVDQAGIVNQQALEIALAGKAYGQNPASQADPGLLKALQTAYKEAEQRRDALEMVRLTDAIHKLGGSTR